MKQPLKFIPPSDEEIAKLQAQKQSYINIKDYAEKYSIEGVEAARKRTESRETRENIVSTANSVKEATRG